jgi:galactonate dehydratase
VRALPPHGPLFLEEPVLPEHPEALREIARLTSVPIACGERLYTRWGFKDVLTSGAVDVIQPDLSHAGGLLETRKIAAMAEAYDVAVAPHCPLGPIALAASLQLDACTPNAVIQEMSLRMHYNEGADLLDYVLDPSVFDVVDGHIAVPEGPGLGVDIDEERVRAAAGGEPWHSPLWRNQDGTVAEW